MSASQQEMEAVVQHALESAARAGASHCSEVRGQCSGRQFVTPEQDCICIFGVWAYGITFSSETGKSLIRN